MKRKTASLIIVLLLLLLSLVLSPFAVAPVKAYGYDYGYGPASVMHACDANPTTKSELRYVYWAFNDIYDLFATRYYYYWYPGYGWYPGYPIYGHLTHSMVWNDSDPYSTTTRDDVLGGIDDVEDYHEFSSFLQVGHGGMQYMWARYHYNFYMNGKGINVAEDPYGVPSVSDLAIRWWHAEDNHHFVFLWVCFNGRERGSENEWPVPPNGMPHCWTQGLIGSSDNGYDWPDGSNYCFIGFDLASPRLEEAQNGASHLYKHWLVFFYYFALVYAISVNQALDHASWCQGFANFAYDRLYIKSQNYPYGTDTYWFGAADHPAGLYDVWMRVYGDGDYHIPGDIYEEPW